MESSTVTSKTGTLKALLLKAWRERWSDLQWGIHIKTVLPRGVSGDVYNLADCMLQQALIGPGPNHLLLSYLRHSLSSQLVSYGAVLQAISKYQGYHKPHCIISLLELLENLQKCISCRGKPEECLVLSISLLSVVQWLLTCIHSALLKLSELQQSPEHTAMLEKPIFILTVMYQCNFTQAMLYLAQFEERDSDMGQISDKCKEIESTMEQVGPLPARESVIEILNLVRKSDPLENLLITTNPPESLSYSLGALIMYEALLRPTGIVDQFVTQLVMVQTLKNYSTADLYSEIIRTCYIGLIDSAGTVDEMRWDGFTFLKLPIVVTKLHEKQQATLGRTVSGDQSADVIAAFETLLQYPPLLNLADVKSACNCMEHLLNGLNKVGMVTEAQVTQLLTKRESPASSKSDQNTSASSSNACLILRAEPTVSSILKTLDADYTKNQEALLGVLCQMMSGKSFELILVASAATGKLEIFAQKLIKFNEYSKEMKGEGSKTSQQRATLFDISFLMLCHIVQTYGPQVAVSEESHEGSKSFFEQWIQENMVERGCSKSPMKMVSHCESQKTDTLLAQFKAHECEFKTSLVRWHEVCLHIPSVIREVLLAWEQGALSTNDVKRLLDNIRSHMCCLSVCSTAWLCSYIRVLQHDSLLKPMNMIQHFMTTPVIDEAATQALESIKERSSLMIQVIRKMCCDVLPPGNIKKHGVTHSIASSRPINDLLQEIWIDIHQKGWLDVKAMHTLESLFCIGGAQWFVTTLIKEALAFPYKEDLYKAVELVFSLFHLDIEKCALALLLHTLPQYLYNHAKGEDLTDPQGHMLAQLSVCVIFSALQHAGVNSTGGRHIAPKKKRDMDFEDTFGPLDGAGPIKMRRLSIHTSETEDLALCLLPGGGTSPIPEAEDILTRAVSGLFRAFQGIAEGMCVQQQTQFVFRFLEECVKCGGNSTRLILQFMPLPLVPGLIKLLPELFTVQVILKLYDLETNVGRKAAARSLCMLHNLKNRS